MITTIGTYLPTWAGPGGARAVGLDEDALTLAVAAGRAALGEDGSHRVTRVVVVSRELPLLDGDNAAALLAGLDVPSDVDVVERLGGGPSTMDSLLAATPGTLVIGADVAGHAGAAAGWVGPETRGGELSPRGRVHRSLPLHVRGQDAVVYDDDDPRLQRERGLRASLAAADLSGKPVAIAGLRGREAAAYCQGEVPELPTLGSSAPLFALAALANTATSGIVGAVEQASLVAAWWDPGDIVVRRHEAAPQPVPPRRMAPGPDIKFAATAYDRAFDAKLRWQAGRCPSCGTLALPPRHRCLNCGEEGTATLVALPRTGTVYTLTTVHVPVPGLASPYSLAVVQLDGVDVRCLVQVTDDGGDTTDIDDRGRLVLRRVAVRSGVPDYGYAFVPEKRN
jgi:uncharacterized OB-fold protein